VFLSFWRERGLTKYLKDCQRGEITEIIVLRSRFFGSKASGLTERLSRGTVEAEFNLNLV
jgi:hypothetical protein